MAKDPAHVTKRDLNKLHDNSPPGCLTRHQKRKKGNTCSHQWQAQEKTEANPGMYNYPAYYTLCDWSPGGVFPTAATGTFPPGYAHPTEWLGKFWKDKPTHQGKEWDIGKGSPKANWEDWRKPYWHNSHHIIPNGALAGAIQDAADDSKEPKLVNLIKAGLLKAKYNLNDRTNMINLPMERIVAQCIGLPRHLKRDESGGTPENFSHADYSRKVEILLKDIMNDYKSAMAKALQKPHPETPDDISKERLEDLSDEIFESIKAAGPYLKGKGLSEMRFGGLG
jgi:hypothetical protein